MKKPQKKTLEYFDYFDCKNYLDWKYGKPSHYGTSFDLIRSLQGGYENGNDTYYTVPSPGPTTFWNPETDEFRMESNEELELFNIYWNEFVGEEYVQSEDDEDEREIVFWVSW